MPVPGTERLESLRSEVRERLTSLEPRMRRLAEEIHRDPELGCAEMNAVTRLAGELEEEEFAVETGVGGLATAVRAARGQGDGPTVAFLAEYDAIPGLGHAAGHNLIVAAAYGAAVALSGVVGRLPGRVMVFGAPAEETIGGKVVLAVRGVFDGVDVAMLAHPESTDRVAPASLASWSVEVVFEGRAAHAVAAPHEGVNALDALIQLFVARDALLKSLRPEVRMPGVILDGGVRANLVPARCRARFSLRAGDARYLADTVLSRFREVVQGVATATGTNATVTPVDNLYDELVTNPVLAEVYANAAESAGLAPVDEPARPFGSLDVGTLSHRVPCIHPLFRITEDENVVAYTAAFADAAIRPFAHRATRRAAEALALTGLELLADPALFDRVRVAHRRVAAGHRRSEDVPLVTGPVDP